MANSEDTFIVPLPGGRCARVPVSVLERHVDAGAKAHHGVALENGEKALPAETLTFDVSAETGAWHVDWELGPCTHYDEAGNPTTEVVWHRHPLGTEFAEVYRP